jgi:hypothetical protein
LILYANGDSHTAGAELVHNFDGRLVVFKEDDSSYWPLAGTAEGRAPHPECLKLSYGQLLANKMGYDFVCDAQSGSSNARILRTTYDYLENNRPNFVVIGWASWEREEWWHEGKAYQITGSGYAELPTKELVEQYKYWVTQQLVPDVMNHKAVNTHLEFFKLHTKLQELGIPHLFFNTFGSFQNLKHLKYLLPESQEREWDDSYVDPYTDAMTYYHWLKARNYQTVAPGSHHYGPAGHEAWADLLYETYVPKVLKN